jgi:hypothetical protein
MGVILRNQLAEQVAEELRSRIHNGTLAGRLPGVRVLSRGIGVSVPTTCRALHLLAGDGLVTGGDRRRWQVVNGARSGNGLPHPEGSGVNGSNRENSPAAESRSPSQRLPAAERRTGRLLFLTSQSLSSERFNGVEVFAHLLDILGDKDWEVLHRVEKFATAKNPRQSWNQLAGGKKIDAWVILIGTPVIGRWAVSQGIPCLFLGGNAGNSGVPRLAVNFGAMLREALARLQSSGHRRILIPLWGRIPELVGRCREAARAVTETADLPAEAITIMESKYSGPEVVPPLLRRAWKKQAPDALVLLDWREFVAASAFFREADLAIPRDLSVIILSHNPNMEWHHPPISHFEMPVQQLARKIARWARQVKQNPSASRLAIKEIHARWVEGGSVKSRA